MPLREANIPGRLCIYTIAVKWTETPDQTKLKRSGSSMASPVTEKGIMKLYVWFYMTSTNIKEIHHAKLEEILWEQIYTEPVWN